MSDEWFHFKRLSMRNKPFIIILVKYFICSASKLTLPADF